MAKQKRLKERILAKTKARYFAAAGLLSISVLLAAFIITTSLVAANTQPGQLGVGEVHSGQNLRRSLDLSLAAKADYPSSALQTVQDLGTDNGVDKQVVRFNVVADGLSEYALLTKPAGAVPAHGYPTIILCHGYTNPGQYQTDSGYLIDMDFYAKNGFVVVKPDLRGQGLSTGQGLADSAYYSMSYNTDIMSLISSLKETNYIDKDNLNLWGHSMGAYLALRAAVISMDIKNVILLSGPVGSLNQIYLNYVPPSDENNPQALKTRQAIFAKYGTPGEDSAFWQAASPTNYLSQSNAKFQIHAGALDSVVPPELSKDLDDQLTALKRAHEYYLYANGPHSLVPQRDLVWSRSLKLMQTIQ
jgi:dipeptidyl aminopeptidase/acylaminoacyl peptidase